MQMRKSFECFSEVMSCLLCLGLERKASGIFGFGDQAGDASSACFELSMLKLRFVTSTVGSKRCDLVA